MIMSPTSYKVIGRLLIRVMPSLVSRYAGIGAPSYSTTLLSPSQISFLTRTTSAGAGVLGSLAFSLSSVVASTSRSSVASMLVATEQAPIKATRPRLRLYLIQLFIRILILHSLDYQDAVSFIKCCDRCRPCSGKGSDQSRTDVGKTPPEHGSGG